MEMAKTGNSKGRIVPKSLDRDVHAVLDSVEIAIDRLRKLGLTKVGARFQAFSMHHVEIVPAMLRGGRKAQARAARDEHFHGHNRDRGHGGGGH